MVGPPPPAGSPTERWVSIDVQLLASQAEARETRAVPQVGSAVGVGSCGDAVCLRLGELEVHLKRDVPADGVAAVRKRLLPVEAIVATVDGRD